LTIVQDSLCIAALGQPSLTSIRLTCSLMTQ
jgi:hypothetical protein